MSSDFGECDGSDECIAFCNALSYWLLKAGGDGCGGSGGCGGSRGGPGASGGGDGDCTRVPQSTQSVPKTQSAYCEPGPPSSQ